MKKLHIYFFAVFICTALTMTGCSDKAVTWSEITEGEVREDSLAETGYGTQEDALSGATEGNTGLTETVPETDQESPATIKVYICGYVLNPGVYELPEGSRICDGLDAAGGFSEGADESRINLAGYLHDGDMVFFPEVGENLPEGAVEAGNSGLININTANAEQLCTLPGIGSSKATSIIKYREENGAFTDISQIMNVSGIGENLFNNIKDLICI